MEPGTAEQSTSFGPPVENTILIVSRSGSISSVVEAADEVRQRIEAGDAPANVDDLWPDAVASGIRQSINRALRTRRSEALQVNGEPGHEILCVPQGPDRAMMIVRDLSEQQAALARITQQAYVDEVTRLPNRENLLAELQKITDIQRLREGRAAMLCIHVGQFDDHGWSLNSVQQDEVLRALAERLVANLRGTNDDDEIDYERYSVAARIDYRQFGVVLPAIEGGEDAEAVGERLIADLGRPVTTGARTVTVTPSIGVALFPQDGTDPATLYQNASAAMGDARNDPGATLKFHSGTVRLRTLQRQDLEIELRSALDKEEYALNFLPVVAAADARPVTMEALLRWPDTLLGTQPIRKIVRIAERTGLILPIGEWVIRRACQQLRRWHAAGFTGIRVAVNLSSQELVSDDIVTRIARILDEEQVDPQGIDIELKEHMLFREVLQDYATCRELRNMGMRIVIDDYGIGACSLAHLSQSPADAIKIDNSFVANLEINERDRAACTAATAMARELGIQVIAEGVETEEQADILRAAGCEYLQGFYFSQPISEPDVFAYLDEARVADADAAGVSR